MQCCTTQPYSSLHSLSCILSSPCPLAGPLCFLRSRSFMRYIVQSTKSHCSLLSCLLMPQGGDLYSLGTLVSWAFLDTVWPQFRQLVQHLYEWGIDTAEIWSYPEHHTLWPVLQWPVHTTQLTRLHRDPRTQGVIQSKFRGQLIFPFQVNYLWLTHSWETYLPSSSIWTYLIISTIIAEKPWKISLRFLFGIQPLQGFAIKIHRNS